MAKFSRILTIINLLLLSGMWIVVAMAYSGLPHTVPTHFGWSGNPDQYGNRQMIWTLPAVSTCLWLCLNYLAGHPQSALLNIPDAMRRQPALVKLFLRCLTTVVILIFLSVCLKVIGLPGLNIDLGLAVPSFLFLIIALLLKFYSAARARQR